MEASKELLGKITQGEWFIDIENTRFNSYNTLCTPISTKLIECFIEVFDDDDEAKANALLISQAPQLLRENIQLKQKLAAMLEHFDYTELPITAQTVVDYISENFENLLNSTNNATR